MSQQDKDLTIEEIEDLARAAECLLFASADPLPRARLAELLECELDSLDSILKALEARLLTSGLQVVRLAGGYALATRPEYAPYITRLREPPKERLSAAALEVLAIVSYRQPITRAEIEAVRGVDSSGSLRSLIEKGLVTVLGRKPAPGRPMLFGTTQRFLDVFGLEDLSDLPEVPEILQDRARQLSFTPTARQPADHPGAAEDKAPGGEQASAKGGDVQASPEAGADLSPTAQQEPEADKASEPAADAGEAGRDPRSEEQ